MARTVGTSGIELARTASPEEDDVSLALRAGSDGQAFTILYERYFDAVYRYCYHRLGNWDEAEDTASLVFVNAYAAIGRFRFAASGTGKSAGSFRSWLFTIAHNAVGNRQRDRKPVHPLSAAMAVADDAPSPDEIAVARDAHETVYRLLGLLPAQQRQLLEFRLAGLNDAEIGALLGMSRGAVRVAQHRIIARLRRHLHAEKETTGAHR